MSTTVVPVLSKSTNEALVNFDAWWSALAKERNFSAHLKEIIWADFQSRGVKKMDSKENFETALKQFGY